uniref:Uncharacterized protein n=1 Tax=Sphaerodactylus townsendi TaxID=933632 RepID=A0ACB8EKF3_9SAUR
MQRQRGRDSLEPGTTAAAAALITIEHLQSHCPNLRSDRPILVGLGCKAWRLILAFTSFGLWKNNPSAHPPPSPHPVNSTLDSASLCCSLSFESWPSLCFLCFG